MSKPSTLLTWATGGTRTNPSAGAQASGYSAAQQPGPRVLNALLGLLWDWAAYLNSGAMNGAFTFDSTVGITGVMTAADYKNSSTRTLRIGAATAQAATSGAPTYLSITSGWQFSSTTGRLTYPVNLTFGDRITGWRAYIVKNSGAGTITGQLFKYNPNTNVETAIGSAATYPSSSGFDILSITGLTADITNAQESHYIVLTGGGTTGDFAYHAEVDYIRP